MGRLFASASTQYGRNTSPVVTASGFTVSLWARWTTIAAANQCLLHIGTATAGGWAIRSRSADSKILFRGWAGGDAVWGTALSTGVWYHIYCRCVADNNRWIYVNGASGVQETTADTVGTAVVTVVAGLQVNATPTIALPFNGDMADLAVWSADLGAGNDMASLAAGTCPKTVRPGSLLSYHRLEGLDSPEPDWNTVGGATRFPLTLTNTPTRSTGGPPTKLFSFPVPTAEEYAVPQTATPDVATITVSGVAPAGSPQGVATGTAGAATVTISGVSPAGSGTGTGGGTPDVATVTLTGVAVAGSGTGTGGGTPDVAVCTVSGVSPVGIGVGTVTYTPDVADVVVTGEDAGATPTTLTIGADAATVTISGVSPAAAGTGAGTATPGVADITVSGVAVAASGGVIQMVGGWIRSVAQRWRKLRRHYGRRTQ